MCLGFGWEGGQGGGSCGGWGSVIIYFCFFCPTNGNRGAQRGGGMVGGALLDDSCWFVD